MGLGKSLQVIATLCAYFNLKHNEVNETVNVIIAAPAVCVRNWYNEFHIWLSKSDYDLLNPVMFDKKTDDARYERKEFLKNWKENGGVLIVGYIFI